jgi:ATP-binding cassette subfamily B multidrug efflux pump
MPRRDHDVAFFEQRIQPTVLSSKPPPPALLAFYWHFVSQTKGLYAALFTTGLIVALIDMLIPVFIGRLVSMMEATDRVGALRDGIPMLAGMALLVLVGPAAGQMHRQPGAQQCGSSGQSRSSCWG